MAYLLLYISVERERVEAVADLLESAPALAVTLSGAGEDELLEPLPGEQPLWRHVRLQALVDPGVDLAALRASLAPAGAKLVDVDFLGEDDWQERWRAYAVRARFGDRLWLLPRDEPFCGADADAAVLRLDPGLAFGSGSHPTTRLCLAGLADQALDGRRVLDFGCGS
ncbi:MAG: 50S ribosomal protein L11 methyltransferase, partial [Pseudomonadales bacterium]